MAQEAINKTMAQLPVTVVLGPNNNDTKIISISQTGLDVNSCVTADFSCSVDGENPFPILVDNGTGGKEPLTLSIKSSLPSSGIIIPNCPAPYIHVTIKTTGNLPATGSITSIQFD